MLTNPHDAYFRGQSRSLNTVPFDVLGMVHGATGPRKKFDDIFSRLDIMLQRDRRTDGHRATAKTALTHSVAR